MRNILFSSTFLVLAMLTACQSAETTKTVNTENKIANSTKNETNKLTTPANSVQSQNADPSKQTDGAERITLADAKKDFDGGNAVFIDTRDEASFKQERIKGAINVSMRNLNERFKDIPKDKKLIVYCS